MKTTEKLNYKALRRDFESLEKIAELKDQQELDAHRLALMENPTKQRAASMYALGILLWFQEHGVSDETAKIAERNQI
jgi:hypothetical protein